ncbi:DUF3549 family protein [Halomonas sp. McH1-25]|uniref:DUF3549 family protein n=1 Tax=unclassified Halomonas TaxID=2609666 RepID=UPI001EF5CC39|nr:MULTISPECIES: DUF3549 family protein [unclassified Halomonas]MCG7600310.1 DUF3549 family protein [Halomonas sp. McH1-25]MCP1342486.1 DUF3549 family protein [Halomonas sp. FL8]MCP1359577.1 DUF3549 family protein [Halomonas sp. BBD45]
MQPILSLCDFFARTGAQALFYTMGRQVAPCTTDTLAAFERGELAWPRPWLGRAQLACVFRLGDEPLIWFLSLPLDEQGMIDPAPRDAFLQRLLETLGRTAQRMDADDSQRVDNLMQDNPLAFTPDLTQRAVLHARASADLALPASEHLELAEAYLCGQLDADQWQALGLQGLADFAIRHDHDQARALADYLTSLPVDVLRPLCHCLEHVVPSPSLVQAIIARGETAAAQGDVETFCACVRAVGQGARDSVGPWYDALLNDTAACGPDMLAAIAARGWAQLEDAERLPRFIDALAADERTGFSAVVRDLALIPRLRLPLLLSLRQAPPDSATGRRLAALAKPN